MNRIVARDDIQGRAAAQFIKKEQIFAIITELNKSGMTVLLEDQAQALRTNPMVQQAYLGG